MQACSDRDIIVQQSLGDLLEKSLDDIRRGLFTNANFVTPAQATTINRERDGVIVSEALPANQRMTILSDKEMILNGRGIGDKGFYTWATGKICLNNKSWCIETVYHETLHAVSLSSVRTDINQQFLFFYEGLTECYTGYLLSKNYNSCYNNCWKKFNSNRACQFTYQFETRVWAAFFQCIDIKETIPIYFYNNSTDFESLFDSFIGRIREINNSNFTNILQEPTTKPIMNAFHQECMNYLGSKYERAFNSNRSTLDLISIIQ